MAGILANSASKVMLSGDTAPDKTVSGYIVNEAIALSLTLTGTSWAWSIAKPSGATLRSDLTVTDAAGPSFVPNVGGIWTISVVIDSTTTYVIRIAVAEVTQTTIAQAFRCSPVLDATVPAPPVGEALSFSKDVGRWRSKNAAGVSRDIDASARTGTFTLSSGAASIADTSVTATTIVLTNCTSESNRGTLTYTVTPGTGIAVQSSDGADASAYNYQLSG